FSTGKIKASLQDNADSRDISIGMRFINTGRVFQTVGIDKSNNGLLVLTCDLTSTNSNDDLINEIADRWYYEITHTYVLSINNGSFMNAPLNDLAQLNITVTDNGIAMNPLPALTFVSSDQDVLVVDNNGKLMGLNIGTATVTCQMTYKDSVKASIDITVVESVSPVYSINITGSTSIKLAQNQSYVAHFYNNGTDVNDKSAVWTISNQDGTTTPEYTTITSSTGNGAVVKASINPTHVNRYVILKATLSDDSLIFKEFTIQVKSLI
ncbi:MAG TPA: hypothetical protein VFD03_07230, partial [Clostridia bacterium]|nr:hypothetical protein [Clostridia bacterium]